MPKAYLDSCVVIYLIQGPESLSSVVRTALRAQGQEPLQFAISDLTLLECRVLPLRENKDELLAQFDDFFASEEIEKTDLGSEVFALATELRARYGTKTPDALHLAAAILAGCSEFWTNDRRLRAATEGRLHLKVFT